MNRTRRSYARTNPGGELMDTARTFPESLEDDGDARARRHVTDDRRLSSSSLWSPGGIKPVGFSTPFGCHESPSVRPHNLSARNRRRGILGLSGPRRHPIPSNEEYGVVGHEVGDDALSDITEQDRDERWKSQISVSSVPGGFGFDIQPARPSKFLPYFNPFEKPKVYKNRVDLDDVLEVTRKFLNTRSLPRKFRVASVDSESNETLSQTPGPAVESMEVVRHPVINGSAERISEETIWYNFRTHVLDRVGPLFRELLNRYMFARGARLPFNNVKSFLDVLKSAHALIREWMIPGSSEDDQLRLYDLPNVKRCENVHGLPTAEYDEATFLKILAEVQGILHAEIGGMHRDFIEEIYALGFAAFNSRVCDLRFPDPPFLQHCISVMGQPDCSCGLCVFEDFAMINVLLHDLQLVEGMAGECVSTLLHSRIDAHVKQTVVNSYDVRHTEELVSWLNGVIVKWFDMIYCPRVDSFKEAKIFDLLEQGASERMRNASRVEQKLVKSQLMEYLFNSMSNVIIDHIFSIVVEFPESSGALDDLKVCLDRLAGRLRQHFIKSLKHIFCDKVLQPGVATQDILTAYVAAIKALRYVDPSGVVLVEACAPVRNYLRTRSDTVKRIVMSLTDVRSGELADELANSDLNPPATAEDDADDDDDFDFRADSPDGTGDSMDNVVIIHTPAKEENEDWESWIPEHWDVRPEHGSRAGRKADIITMLVNIYGSRKVFIQEYRKILAARILEDFYFDLDREIRCKEFLKLRFGETYLHNCEVMLKDVQASQRLNSLLQNDSRPQEERTFSVAALIRSVQFWPDLARGEPVALPPLVMAELDQYRQSFEVMKGNRTLVWETQMGEVELEVELKDRVLDVVVPPIMACIILNFQERPSWTLAELSEKLRVPPAYLKRKLRYWQARRVIREIKPDYYLQFETIEDWIRADRECFATIPTIAYYDNDDEVERECAADVGQTKMDAFWSYIVGMLTNIKALPLNRIHSMLKMFAMQEASAEECSIEELKEYLQTKVCNQELMYAGNVFRLPPSQ